MSSYAAPPDAVGLGGGDAPPPGGMAALAAALGAGPGGPTDGAGLPPALSDGGAGGPGGGAGSDATGTDLLSGMSSTDHIRAAIKHLMMAMTESNDDQETAGIGKGMTALHGLLAGKAKDAKTVTAAGGTPGA